MKRKFDLQKRGCSFQTGAHKEIPPWRTFSTFSASYSGHCSRENGNGSSLLPLSWAPSLALPFIQFALSFRSGGTVWSYVLSARLSVQFPIKLGQKSTRDVNLIHWQHHRALHLVESDEMKWQKCNLIAGKWSQCTSTTDWTIKREAEKEETRGGIFRAETREIHERGRVKSELN